MHNEAPAHYTRWGRVNLWESTVVVHGVDARDFGSGRPLLLGSGRDLSPHLHTRRGHGRPQSMTTTHDPFAWDDAAEEQAARAVGILADREAERRHHERPRGDWS